MEAAQTNARSTELPVVKSRILIVFVLVTVVQSLYPITADGSTVTLIIYQVIYASLVFAGIAVTRGDPSYNRLLTALGVLWIIVGSYYAFNQASLWALILAYLTIATFLSLVVKVLLEYIFTVKHVNREVLFAASATYLLFGAIFVPIYGIIESLTFLQTGGGHAFSDVIFTAGEFFPWQSFIYYSYATLTTLGYGDVLPLTMWARSVASLEAVLGVLYITVVMARLVGLYSMGAESD
jgi:hypothetical protein